MREEKRAYDNSKRGRFNLDCKIEQTRHDFLHRLYVNLEFNGEAWVVVGEPVSGAWDPPNPSRFVKNEVFNFSKALVDTLKR